MPAAILESIHPKRKSRTQHGHGSFFLTTDSAWCYFNITIFFVNVLPSATKR